MKYESDYWDTYEVNTNGIPYILSDDEKTLDFRLSEHDGAIIRFDVYLPGGYLRKQEILQTLINSFEETESVNTNN